MRPNIINGDMGWGCSRMLVAIITTHIRISGHIRVMKKNSNDFDKDYICFGQKGWSEHFLNYITITLYWVRINSDPRCKQLPIANKSGQDLSIKELNVDLLVKYKPSKELLWLILKISLIRVKKGMRQIQYIDPGYDCCFISAT